MKKHLMILSILALICSGLVFYSGCAVETTKTSTLSVDVVYPFSQECSASFKNGIELAAREINDQGIRRIAVVHSAGNTYGKDYIQKVEEHAGIVGIEIVDAVSYLPNLDYFRYYLKKWDSLGAQAIVSACVGDDITALYGYLEKTGNTRPVFASYDIEIQPYTIPQSMKNLTQVTSYFNNTATAGPEAAFIQAYQQAYGKSPDLPAAQAYMTMHLAAAAANQAQSLDTAALKKVLGENSFETVYGRLSFDKRLIMGIPVFQKIYVNDQLVPRDNVTGGGQASE